jgi:hypothetical protein
LEGEAEEERVDQHPNSVDEVLGPVNGSMQDVSVGERPYVRRVLVGCHEVAKGVADEPQQKGKEGKHSPLEPERSGSVALDRQEGTGLL